MKRPIHTCKFFLLAALLTAATVIAGAGCEGRAPAPPSKTLVVDSDQSGKVIVVEGRDLVSIKLFGNPSTGYHWVLATVEGKSLEYVGAPHSEPASRNPQHLDGGDTYYMYYDFRVVGTGETKVILEYRGPGADQKLDGVFSAFFDVRGTAPATAMSAP